MEPKIIDQWTVQERSITTSCQLADWHDGFEGIVEWQPVGNDEGAWMGAVQEHEEAIGVVPSEDGFRIMISADCESVAREIVSDAATELNAFAYPGD